MTRVTMPGFVQHSGLLTTDFYQLAMAHAYAEAGMTERAVFEFFVRHLPPRRAFLIAAGLGTLLDLLEGSGFSEAELDWLRSTGRFPSSFVDSLREWRFHGDIDAVPEGTLVFENEPLLRVTAPLPEAQLIETLAINILHYQTMVASKAARMVAVAGDRPLIDFGLRRAHSLEAGLYAARAAYIAGFAGTATTSAGAAFGIPVFGTMAHSFIQAHETEAEAFLNFARARPHAITLLIDTYDTLAAARCIVELRGRLEQLGADIRAVRIDSGDLAACARGVRRILDVGGLPDVRIMVSGGLDEWSVQRLVQSGAPIDSYGVGTSLTTSDDQPHVDSAYKLVEYAGTARRKKSPGKVLWPGVKQVYRVRDESGRPTGDVLALAGETIGSETTGEPLLAPVMRDGVRLELPDLDASRARARHELQAFGSACSDLDSPCRYQIDIAPGLRRLADSLEARGR